MIQVFLDGTSRGFGHPGNLGRLSISIEFASRAIDKTDKSDTARQTGVAKFYRTRTGFERSRTSQNSGERNVNLFGINGKVWTMSTVAVACIKNEEDIIEPLVRHTCRLVDHMIVMDDGSYDDSR